jgi:pyruvate dehydrogenase E2 component (dihydrolipoamide acetyltransferase)
LRDKTKIGVLSVAVEKIQVPDLGSDGEVEVIEVLVKPGDTISENDSLVVLESDKAAMEVPSPKSGVVKEVLVKVGSQVKNGSDLISMEVTGGAAAAAPKAEAPKAETPKEAPKAEAPKVEAPKVEAPKPAAAASAPGGASAPKPAVTGAATVKAIEVPDLGGVTDVEVIDVMVKVGDVIKAEASLVTLETDKAAMEVPSPLAGKVVAIKVKVGDKVSAGSMLIDLETASATAGAAAGANATADAAATASQVTTPASIAPKAEATAAPAPQAKAPVAAPAAAPSAGGEVHAGPAVRKLARELGVDLSQVTGTGGRGRIIQEDVQAHVKARMQAASAGASASQGAGIPGIPDQDFSKFGPVEEVEMTKLHRVTALNMARNWLNVPHVTQFDEADITDLEDFRAAQKTLADKKGIKLTPLPFIVKACAQALVEHPQFNVSLHSSGAKLIRKKYVNIGVAVATPAGLMVPVIKNADKLSIWQIAAEIAALGAKAKDRKLTKEDMEGACFTISSLGNIGGNGFTPIVNAPEVAILGVSRASVKPVWKNNQFVPRTILPFSLSYDHRAVNGVDGGNFCTYLGTLLSDIRLMVL